MTKFNPNASLEQLKKLTIVEEPEEGKVIISKKYQDGCERLRNKLMEDEKHMASMFEKYPVPEQAAIHLEQQIYILAIMTYMGGKCQSEHEVIHMATVLNRMRSLS